MTATSTDVSGRPPVNRLPFRRLIVGPRPGDDRVVYYNVWNKGPNSPQVEGLIPRLRRLDCYLSMCSQQWLVRAVQFRALMATRHVRHRVVISAAAKRYRWLLAHDPEQVRFFPGRVVLVLDDPGFTSREAELIMWPNVAAYVMTSDAAVRRFEQLGVEKPAHVIPLGSEVETLTEDGVRTLRDQHRRPGEIVVGYIAAALRLPGDRYADNPLHNVEHLLDLWDQLRDRIPNGRLWLVGDATQRVRDRTQGRDDIVLFGRVPQTGAMPFVANFDIALYPRTADQGVRASKIADYMGAGVPTVSYDYEVVSDLKEAGAGVLVKTPAEFVDAVERLAKDDAERSRLAVAARRAGRERDWRVLAPRFEREVLDRYLA